MRLMRWLVISDIHFNNPNYKYDAKTLRDKLLETLQKDVETRGKFSFILITGDIFHKYIEDDGVVDFIKKLAKICKVKIKRGVVICPGNHDVERYPKGHSSNELIDEARKEKNPEKMFGNGRYMKFATLYQSLFGHEYKHVSQYSPSDNKDCIIVSIDSCTLTKDKLDIGNLRVCSETLAKISDKLKKSNASLKIAVMHHGINWLAQDDANKFQDWLYTNKIDVLYCGHDHAVGISTLDEAIGVGEKTIANLKQFTCGACLYDDGVIPSYYVCEYNENDSKKKIMTELYTFRENTDWSLDGKLLRSFPGGKNTYFLPRLDNRIDNLEKFIDNTSSHNFRYKLYNNLNAAEKDICNDLETSSRFYFFGLRGKSFIRYNSDMANYVYSKPDMLVKLLVSYPFCKAVANRLNYLPDLNNKDTLENYWVSLYDMAKTLKTSFAQKRGEQQYKRKLRYHKLPLNWRMLITDQHLFFSFYQECDSSLSPMYAFDAESDMYKAFWCFFDEAWRNSSQKLPDNIPYEYTFLKDRFNIVPNLVINVTDACNLKCEYCPEGGENLITCDKLCPTDKILYLVDTFYDQIEEDNWQANKSIRITGGEPLLIPEKTLQILEYAYNKGYHKLVLCTNGLLLEKIYTDERYHKTLELIKDRLLLKISLDTLEEKKFEKISKVSGEKLKTILCGIHKAKSEWNFNIELNCVVTNDNIKEVLDIYEFARQEHLIGVKVLTVNDFGGLIPQPDIRNDLDRVYDLLKKNPDLQTEEAYLYGNNGIQMRRFFDDENCKLTIVDHQNQSSSITPRRTYSSYCKKCPYYPKSVDVLNGKRSPCATGIMSLTLRADGVLCYCRLRTEEKGAGINISFATKEEIFKAVHQQLYAYQGCQHYGSSDEVK